VSRNGKKPAQQYSVSETASTSAVSAKSTSTAAAVVDADEEDEVRAPIPQKQERLVAAHPHLVVMGERNPHRSRVRTVFDGFRNFEAESKEGTSAEDRKRKTLAELFKPPFDLRFAGDWLEVKAEGEKRRKWLLVNIQVRRILPPCCFNLLRV